MVMMDAFLGGEGSIEFPSERATCRDERATGHVFRRFSTNPARGACFALKNEKDGSFC